MDDAVGFLVGPEFVRSGGRDARARNATANEVAKAAAVAASTAAAPPVKRGSFPSPQQFHSATAGDDVAAGGMRADEVRHEEVTDPS